MGEWGGGGVSLGEGETGGCYWGRLTAWFDRGYDTR